MNSSFVIEISIEDNIDFILSHFKDQLQLYPRKIMVSDFGKFSISNKIDLLSTYKRSNFIDCKINAYPEFVQYKGINRISCVISRS